MLSLVCIIFALFFAYGKLLDFATAYPIGVGKPNGSVTLNRRVDLRLGYRRHRQALGDAARGVEIEGNAAAAIPTYVAGPLKQKPPLQFSESTRPAIASPPSAANGTAPMTSTTGAALELVQLSALASVGV